MCLHKFHFLNVFGVSHERSCENNIVDMAGKLSNCFSVKFSHRHCYNMENVYTERGKIHIKDDSNERYETTSDGNETYSSPENECEFSSEEEIEDIGGKKGFTWTLINEPAAIDFSQHDFSVLNVGKHVLKLSQLHSLSQDYRLNKGVNDKGDQEKEATQQQEDTRGSSQHEETRESTHDQQQARENSKL